VLRAVDDSLTVVVPLPSLGRLVKSIESLPCIKSVVFVADNEFVAAAHVMLVSSSSFTKSARCGHHIFFALSQAMAGLHLRSEPCTNASVLSSALNGESFVVTDGPVSQWCACVPAVWS
jgi:hypothetical protein